MVSVVRETAADIGAELRAVAEPAVADAVSRIAFMALAVLMVPVGILVLIATSIAFAVATTLIHPTGMVASVLALTWLLGTLGALVVAFRAIYRRLPRRLRAAYADGVEPRRATPGMAASTNAGAATSSLPSAAAPPLSLAELDARFVPPADRSDRRER